MSSETSPIQRVRALLATNGTSGTTPDLRAMRAGMEAIPEGNPPADDVTVEWTTLAQRPAAIIRTPGASPGRVIYHVHGGGLVAGSPASHRSLLGELSRSARAEVIAIDYRKAPECPFPAAYDDVYAGFEELAATGRKIAVSGDSGGAGLALSVASRATQSETPVSVGVLLSPWADLTLSSPSLRDLVHRDPVIDINAIHWMARVYAGETDPRDRRVSPINIDFQGLPPMLIQVGSDEVLLDDALEIDRRARAAAVDVTLEVWPEMIHGWHLWTSYLEESHRAIARAGSFIQAHLTDNRS
ncbi:alpha/beta hydrolase [Paraburkholderia tropica]|uniref:alpha/beta hydrolase n=1 Tax=Paraburkholderia tropica TaxID=92647 RepID=UPI002ABD7EA9|nr:alpha/beta hydrolase [Paraburkholderia tropica]